MDMGQPFAGFDFGGFGDIFDAFFGGTTRRRREAQRGADRRVSLEIDLPEAAFGCEREIEVQRVELCPRCGGKRAEPGSQPARCPACNGSGEVRRVQRSFFGQFVNIAACSQCQGEGSIITQACKECRGGGRQQRHRQLLVKIPAGVSDGSQMRLRGEGDAGLNGGAAGHLYVLIHVRPHSIFQQEEDDLVYDLGLSFPQAALGCHVEVPTLEDSHKVSLTIPPGTQGDRVFVMKGKGVPHLHGDGRGDLRVRVKLAVPTQLTAEQRQLLLELAQTMGAPAASDGDKGILGKIKDALS
jgi:molecular chaperone DnaJ